MENINPVNEEGNIIKRTTVLALSLSLLLLSVAVLSGCGTNNEVSNGAIKMLHTTGQLAKAIGSSDQVKVKELGPKLESQWSVYGDQVKKDHKDLYEKTEIYLDPTVAGSKTIPLDKQALGSLNKQLTKVLK